MDKRTTIEIIHAGVKHIRTNYLSELAKHGYHVLYTIPIWNVGSKAPFFGLTDIIMPQISSADTTVASLNTSGPGKPPSPTTEPVILLLGMRDGTPPPKHTLDHSTNWIVRTNRHSSYGTVAVSGSVFLTPILVPVLEKVNAATTIIPSLHGMDYSRWRLELRSWRVEESRKEHKCKFTRYEDTAQPQLLKYKWEHRDSAVYQHDSRDHISNGDYSVVCKAPTTF